MTTVCKADYEREMFDIYQHSDDPVSAKLSLRECLALEIETIKYEMLNRSDDYDHWVERFEAYIRYVS